MLTVLAVGGVVNDVETDTPAAWIVGLLLRAAANVPFDKTFDRVDSVLVVVLPLLLPPPLLPVLDVRMLKPTGTPLLLPLDCALRALPPCPPCVPCAAPTATTTDSPLVPLKRRRDEDVKDTPPTEVKMISDGETPACAASVLISTC